MTKKDNRIKTPKGVAVYPYIEEPYKKFKSEGQYKVTLQVAIDDPELKPFCEAVKTYAKEGDKNLPYAMNKELNVVEIKAASGFAPNVYDSEGKRIESPEERIGGGSILRLSCEPAHYDGFGGGVNLYLQAVQIIKLEPLTGGSAEDYGFEKEDGYKANTPSSEPEDDDDLPF